MPMVAASPYIASLMCLAISKSWQPRTAALLTLAVVLGSAAGGWWLFERHATIAKAQVLDAEGPALV